MTDNLPSHFCLFDMRRRLLFVMLPSREVIETPVSGIGVVAVVLLVPLAAPLVTLVLFVILLKQFGDRVTSAKESEEKLFSAHI